jgi:FkbM family methyltransferase
MISTDSYLNTPLDIEGELLDYFKYSKPKLIFDIGACDGLDSIKYSRIFPKSVICAFEPIENNYLQILNNIIKYNIDTIKVEKIALSDIDGEAVFYLSSGFPGEKENDDWNFGNKSSSLLVPDKTIEIHPWLKFESKEIVKTKTLHTYLLENNVKLVDIIHLDVQGAELMVLRGAKNYLSKVKMIWLEVENISLYKDQPLKNEVELFLMSNNFHKIKDTVNHIAGDQLWVNFDFFPLKKLTRNIYQILKSINFLK